MPAKKKWNVTPAAGGESIEVEAERMQLDEQRARVTFYDGDEVVATFVGVNSAYPASANKSS